MDNPNIIPQKDRAASLIAELRCCRLSHVSAQKMAVVLTQAFGALPYVATVLPKGSGVLRVRLNEAQQNFHSEKELSYRPDVNNIKTYGRASVPLQSVFYGTLVSTTLVDALNTTLWETSQIFTNRGSVTPEEFVFTLGYWTVTDDIRASEVVFSKRFIERIPQVRNSYEAYLKGYRSKLSPEKVDILAMMLEFYSEQFARTDIRSHEDYLISATYSQLLFDYEKIEAIIYPSARVDNQGMNIALTPLAVEKKMRLNEAKLVRAKVRRRKRTAIAFKKTTSLGFLNSEFVWKEETHPSEETNLMNCWLMSDC